MLLEALRTSMLRSILIGKGIMRRRRGYINMNHLDKNFLSSLHPVSNSEITKYFNDEPRFSGVFRRDNYL